MFTQLRTRRYRLFTVLFIAYVLSVAPAFAYLDPGSGSYFVQLMIAGMAGGAYVVKLYYARIVGFFKSKDKKKDE